MSDLEDLQKKVRKFAGDRNWDQFHSPKNLSMALIAEAAELVEHFQWLTEEQSHHLSPDQLTEVKHEIADIFIYLLRISDKLGVDPVSSAHQKIALNEKKYPVEKVHGSAKKYTAYMD